MGYGRWAAVGVATATGLVQPVGALIGALLGAASLPLLLPFVLALAAGAMIFVVSHEVIPESHRNGHETTATFALLGGFALMLLVGQAFG